jgi:hypothetical protein
VVSCCSSETAAAADYFLALRTNVERNAKFSHFPHDLVQSVCALHRYRFCRVGCCVRSSAKNQGKEKKEVLGTSTCKLQTTGRAVPQIV